MRIVVLFTICTLLCCCKRSDQSSNETTDPASTADTAVAGPVTPNASATASPDYEYEDMPVEKHEVIDYSDQWDANKPGNAFQPFGKLKSIATHFVRHKDSLREVGGDTYAKHENSAHALIMEYKREIESGKYSQGDAVSLLDIPRTLGNNDSSSSYLPVPKSSFFTNGNFFFIGGAPFVQRHVEYDTATNQEIAFTGRNGKPELRLASADTENRYHLLKSIMQFKKPRVKISFGGPVPIYDGPMDEVKGIGSIIHTFVEEIPVTFLMETGVVQGSLKYYQEPFTEQYSCYSSYPYLIFSCASELDVNQIIGIYISYGDKAPTSCSITRPDKWSWSADVNNDSIPDIACVIGTYDSVQDGVPEMLWYVNVNGTWKIVDYGMVPSCT